MVHPDTIKVAISQNKIAQNIHSVTEGTQRADKLHETVAKALAVCIILGFAFMLFVDR
jgi:hypothetical protein